MIYKKDGLDIRELKILSELRKNSRQSLTQISRKINIPVSTIFDKLIKLNNAIIKKNISLFDFDKLGYNIKVNFIVKNPSKKHFKKFLLNKININSLYRINNYNNYHIECFFKNLNELEIFKEELIDLGIKDLKEYHVVEEIKKEEFFTKPIHIEMAHFNK
jgi:DNA-binding Lrp family transcriptional regulator